MPETRIGHGAVIKNERLKLYKRTSTWVLLGVIFACIILYMLVIVAATLSYRDNDSNNSYWNMGWKENYQHQLASYQSEIDRLEAEGGEDAADMIAYNKNAIEHMRYCIDNDIPPWDWREIGLQVVYYGTRSGGNSQYYYDRGHGYSSGIASGQPAPGDDGAVDEAYRARVKEIVEKNDWKAFVQLEIEDIREGRLAYDSDQEKQAAINIRNMQLEYGIVPMNPNSGYGYLPEASDWRMTELNTMEANTLSLIRGEKESMWGESTPMTRSERAQTQNEIDLSIKRLQEDIEPMGIHSMYAPMEMVAANPLFLAIAIAVLTCIVVASEFTTGTVKLLLITPHKRSRIYWAKTRMLTELSLMMGAALFILAFLVCGLISGFNGVADSQIYPLFGQVVRLPVFVFVLLRSVLQLLPVLACGALALMLASVTRQNALSMAVSLILTFGGFVVAFFLGIFVMQDSRFSIPGVEFILFSNTDPTVYFPRGGLEGMVGFSSYKLNPSMTLPFSLVIMALYTALFLWIGRDSFCRRDVK